jgi:hypothetical protein
MSYCDRTELPRSFPRAVGQLLLVTWQVSDLTSNFATNTLPWLIYFSLGRFER